MKDVPLGQPTDYPETYAPSVLVPIARNAAREPLGITQPLPFKGVDIWNAWELTWLEPGGRPVTATAEIRVPADSPNIVESKSLKLYLGSFAMSEYRSAERLAATIGSDLAGIVGVDVDVDVRIAGNESPSSQIARLPGESIDARDAHFGAADVDPSLLTTNGDAVVEESLHTHLLRSLCPVTSQPDFGSLLVSYRGRRIDPGALLAYVVSFRRHNDFHEACIERMYMDIMARCKCEALTVYARYNRRGGIDINPYRTNTDDPAENLRLWRQ